VLTLSHTQNRKGLVAPATACPGFGDTRLAVWRGSRESQNPYRSQARAKESMLIPTAVQGDRTGRQTA
jgi:hypothetical protein